MPGTGYKGIIGTGGIGSGILFELAGDHTLGRNESREGKLSPARDFCKLHIILHYVAVLMRSGSAGSFRTVPVGRVGSDGKGGEMLRLMKDTGMDTSLVMQCDDQPTMFSVCFQYPDSSGGNITTAGSASSRLTPQDIRRAAPVFQSLGNRGMALAAPEVPLESRLELLRLARENNLTSFSAFTSAELGRPLAAKCIELTDFLALNRDEAGAVIGDGCPDEELPARLGEKLNSINPEIRILLTLGAQGSWGIEAAAIEHVPALLVPVLSTAGAGDASLAGLICATAAGAPFILPGRGPRKSLTDMPIEDACEFAALLGSYSVVSMDTINLSASPEAIAGHARSLGLECTGGPGRLLEV